MAFKQTVLPACHSRFSRITQRPFQILQYHRLILAWCALVVLYGKAKSKLFFKHNAN
jgi:hypothetical protein